MSRMIPMDTLEMLHFVKQSMETLKGSFNNPKSVSLRAGRGRITVVVSGYDIINADQTQFDGNLWKVNVELTDFKGRFKLSPSVPHRLVVGD